MADEAKQKKPRAESLKEDLSNHSTLAGLVLEKKKGKGNPAWGNTYWDTNNTGFGLRLSPKGFPSWTWKFRGYDKGHVEGSIPFFIAPKVKDEDGTVQTVPVPHGHYDYLMAVEHYRKVREKALMTPAEREKASRTGMTLAEAFPKYLANKVKRKTQQHLAEETQQAYEDQWRWLGPIAGDWVLKDTDSFQWQHLFEEEAMRACIKREILRSVHEGLGAGAKINGAQKLAVIKRLERGLPEKWQEESWWVVLTKDERDGVEKCLNSVKPSDIKELESSPVWQAANLVSGIYTYFADDNNRLFNPIKPMKGRWRVKKPARRVRAIPTLNMPEFWKALQNRKKVKVSKDCITIILLTGFRNSAARRMRWDQVDFERGLYKVKRGDIGWKGFVGDMPLSDAVLDLLRERRAADPHGKWVFPAHVTRSDGCLSRLGDSVKKCCEEMGLERADYYIPHDLRRGFSTAVKTVTGNDFQMVATLLGHQWAADKNDETLREEAVTFGYLSEEMQACKFAVNQAAEFLLQVSKAKPMEKWVAELLKKKGIDPAHYQPDETLPEPDSDDADDTAAKEEATT
ncbi:tyrosine-type recombinase/integrase [Burkholderia pseudomallei]|uniref:tyrosine-type recombinase/integrase n=1 Tax=Burkholderia pseudomallei TaxID=28450 RepID=UPI00193D4D6E|nr:tyrosine-type recombinase/integrase [Burkholderia pseudomallei]QRM23562.1 tyrosine-type recombinase/integrase [Burkholderia pseudomallei]